MEVLVNQECKMSDLNLYNLTLIRPKINTRVVNNRIIKTIDVGHMPFARTKALLQRWWKVFQMKKEIKLLEKQLKQESGI